MNHLLDPQNPDRDLIQIQPEEIYVRALDNYLVDKIDDLADMATGDEGCCDGPDDMYGSDDDYNEYNEG